jgi:hypothetical protein
MALDRFLIAPFNVGMQTNLKPWLIPEQAFEYLENMYVFRGRVRKRFGSRYTGFGWTSNQTAPLHSRLRILLGQTDVLGNITGSVPGIKFHVGQAFSIDNAIFTVSTLGNPGNMLRTDGVVATATYNTTTGNYVINGATPLTDTYFYPAEPVMGIGVYQIGPINSQPTIAFDTQFAYEFTAGSWNKMGPDPISEWHGDNTNFFWTTTWVGRVPNDPPFFFVTNFFVTNPNGTSTLDDDPIWVYDQSTTTWTSIEGPDGFYFLPQGGAPQTGPFVKTARIIVGFHKRLVLLNTIENDNSGGGGAGNNTQHKNRARFSQNGSPFAVNAWYEPDEEDSAGNRAVGGNFVDASTEEAIVSAEFIKDRLIVYFERSTWELVYTSNEAYPFTWQKLNTELGSMSTFSTVPFDKVVLTIGQTGVHACNGSNVQRVDTLIPDQVFEIQDVSSQSIRVFGIRDFFVEMVYWSYPSIGSSPFLNYPNQVLVYNYLTGAWGVNDDCITAFGYLNQQVATTWENTTLIWGANNNAWNSGSGQSNFRQVIAGNQEGFMFIVDPNISLNAPVMQLSNIVVAGAGFNVVIKDHNFILGDYLSINTVSGTGNIPDLNGKIFRVNAVIDADTIYIEPNFVVAGTYQGGGTIARVSNVYVLSKQWNPYVNSGSDVYLAKIDFGVTRTQNGKVLVDYFPSASSLSMVTDGTATGTIMGNNVLETYPYDPAIYPFEQVQQRLWHPIYFQSGGESIQIAISMNDEQMRDPLVAYSDFQIEGMVLFTQPTSNRLE